MHLNQKKVVELRADAPEFRPTASRETVHLVPPPAISSAASHTSLRRGKAPPVDTFDGENGETSFDDWLPALERAVVWNAWSDTESLIQFAGHLRGRALQEWNLIEPSDKNSFTKAVDALRKCLDPGSRILAAQDFRHAVQSEDELVADYIRRLPFKWPMAKKVCLSKLGKLYSIVNCKKA